MLVLNFFFSFFFFVFPVLEFHGNRCYVILMFVILDEDISLRLCDFLSENYIRNKIKRSFKIILHFVE